MTSPPSLTVFFAALLTCGGVCVGCKSKSAAPPVVAARTPVPGDSDCYQLKTPIACPADPSDPSGKNLPTPGHECKMQPCSVCGSATAPAFRDFDGAPVPGWCICVPRSDDAGPHIFSCFTPEQWKARSQ